MPFDDPETGLKKVQNNLTVRLISTPRSDFITCASDEDLENVVERNRTLNYDFLPVVEPISDKTNTPARIIGLLDLKKFMQDSSEPAEPLVRHKMSRLSEENLIGAE